MALNFSPSPVFTAAERGFGSPVRERAGDGFGKEEAYDVVDLLPDDPFGMNAGSTLTAAIAGWIEDLKEECTGEKWGLDDRYGGLQDLDYYWSAAYFSPKTGFSGCGDGYCKENGVLDFSGCLPYSETFSSVLGSRGGGILGSDWLGGWSSRSAEDSCGTDPRRKDPSTSYDDSASRSDGLLKVPGKTEEARDVEDRSEPEATRAEGSSSAAGVGGLPHDAMLFVLRFLDVQDLLSVEMVSKMLRSAVRSDPYLWRCMHIHQPLNKQLTDEALLQLTQRADGNVQCLSLVDCSKITNDGLKRVLEANGKITKLNLHGCGRLTVEGLLDSFKPLKTPGHPPIKHLMIGGIFASSEEHYEDLISLLDLDISQHSVGRSLRFYHRRHASPSCDYDRVLDVEVCPKCQSWRLLYDCPAESCREKVSEPCRGCTICIPRCCSCGRCVTDDEYEETFYLDYLCSVCTNHLCKTQEGYEASFGKVLRSSSSVPVSGAAQVAEHTAVE